MSSFVNQLSMLFFSFFNGKFYCLLLQSKIKSSIYVTSNVKLFIVSNIIKCLTTVEEEALAILLYISRPLSLELFHDFLDIYSLSSLGLEKNQHELHT